MCKSLIAALSLLGATAVMAADEPASPHTFTGNVTVTSAYQYRGLAQTDAKPAIQGGFDYAHASGFYVGNWNSSVNWISDAGLGASNSIEMDFYGGFKLPLGDFTLDLGGLYYYYPGSYPASWLAAYDKPNTFELYVAGSWKWLTLKYSVSTTPLFGNKSSEGSGYLELNAAYDLGSGWGLSAHIGNQTVNDTSNADYSDWKLGVSKDVGFGTISAAYIDSNADKSFYYNTANDDLGKGLFVLSFTKTM